MNLQGLVAQTPAGGICDLGDNIWPITNTVTLDKPLTIIGEGARIVLADSQDRSLPNLMIRGPGIHLRGSVTVVGSRPNGAPYNQNREAQHGLWLQGATGFTCDGWTIANTWGDGIYLSQSMTGAWSDGLTFTNVSMHELGRQCVSLVACRNVTFGGFTFGKSQRSVFDIEPPGHQWGATGITIRNGTVSSPNGELLACKGVGAVGTVGDIHLVNIKCVGRTIDCRVLPPAGVRRANFSIVDCTSDTTANSSPLRFNAVDGVMVRGNVQPLAHGVALVDAVDCTEVAF